MCDIVVPELESQLQRVQNENQKLKLESDPFNVGHRARLLELERQNRALHNMLWNIEQELGCEPGEHLESIRSLKSKVS